MGTAIMEQYLRLREGDRFYFENTEVSAFTPEEVAEIKSTKLSHIFLRNFPGIRKIQCSVFYTSNIRDCGPDAEKPTDNNSTTIVGLDGKLNITWLVDVRQSNLRTSLSYKLKYLLRFFFFFFFFFFFKKKKN